MFEILGPLPQGIFVAMETWLVFWSYGSIW